MHNILRTRGRRVAVAFAALTTMVAVGCDPTPAAPQPVAHAILRDPSGATVGLVLIWADDDGHATVRAKLQSNAGVTASTFHGFHIHANNDAANGEGCLADPSLAATTWFVSADGHLKADGQTHGAHVGDMPSLLVNADGTAQSTFVTDRLDAADLGGKAIVLHAGADNFGNVPVGAAEDQYTANTPAAVTKTEGTGNAGNRVACGLIVATGEGSAATP